MVVFVITWSALTIVETRFIASLQRKFYHIRQDLLKEISLKSNMLVWVLSVSNEGQNSFENQKPYCSILMLKTVLP